MRSRFFLLATLGLLGCPKDTTPGVTGAGVEGRQMPEPLAARDFVMPVTETRTLSNGLTVVVATNDEVPLWSVRIVLNVGGALDPEGKEGLAESTFDMLNEGAGDLTAEDISRELKRLGSSVGTWAGTDSAGVSASGLKRNLEPTLDLWTTVLTAPTFPDEDWSIIQKRSIADVVASREDPVSVSRSAGYRVLYGDTYRGRQADEASYEAIGTADMRAFYRQWVGPENAMIFVSGDLTADEVVPLIEARIGTWKPADIAVAEPTAELPTPEAPALYFIDKPGAAQSVIRVLTPVGTRNDDDWFDFYMANQVFGGTFTARLNMNLREDKGYTYGARCFIGQWDGPGVWGCSTSVQTEVTGPALTEMKREIDQMLGGKPVTDDELAYFTSNEVHGFPGGFETSGALLDAQADIWRYGLRADWLEHYLPGVRGVTVETANQSFRERVKSDRLVWVIVGDKESMYGDLAVLGLPVVELDRDGNPLQGE